MKRGGSHLRIVDTEMTWLIIGGTGQLGIALSHALKKAGIVFSAWGSSDLDIEDEQKVKEAIAYFNPSVIVNCAAWTDVDAAEENEDRAFRINAVGAENVAIAAKTCAAKLIHISTDYVFSGESETPWKIDDKCSPNSAYGRTKLAGEEKVFSAYPERSLLIRTAWLYSPWEKNFLRTVLRLASVNSEQIPMVNDQIGQPTSAMDLAIRIIELAESSIESGIFHGTNSGAATWFDFASEIMRLNGDDQLRLKPVSSSDFVRLAPRPKFSVLDHSAWEKYGFLPMQDWKLALHHTMATLESEDETGMKHA
jgi:dTDP-4-dehydrorhamnose reductase